MLHKLPLSENLKPHSANAAKESSPGGTQNRARTFSEFWTLHRQVGTALQGQGHTSPLIHCLLRVAGKTEQWYIGTGTEHLQEPEFTNSRAKRAQEERKTSLTAGGLLAKMGSKPWDSCQPDGGTRVLSTSDYCSGGRQYQLRLPGSSLETRNPHFGRNTTS